MASSRSSVQHISQFAARKEQEWREANEQRLTALQLAMKEAEEELGRERARFQQLEDDFKFNLQVVQERDAELERYDSVFSQISVHLSGKDSEVSELRISVDELSQKLQHARDGEHRAQQEYAARLQGVQQDAELLRVEKDKQLRDEREQFEASKRDYQLLLTKLEEDSAQKNRNISSAFEEALGQREHEFQLSQDELSSTLHSRELQLRSVSGELEKCKQSLKKCQDECRKVEEASKQNGKLVQEMRWTSESQDTTQKARISELETELLESRQEASVLRRNGEERSQQLQETLQELKRSQEATREAHSQECHKYQSAIAQHRAEIENSRAECRRLQWCSEETGRQRAEDVCRLQRDLEEVRAEADQLRSTASQDCAARDVETRTLREQVKLARQRQEQHDKELEKYKAELQASLARQSSMERTHDKEHLEWQQRLETCQHQQHQRQEELVEALMKARDEATALAEQRLSELSQRDRVLRLLQASRAQALRVLEENGLENPGGEAELVALAEDTALATDLQIQNENLRTVIRAMREEMEQLGAKSADTAQKYSFSDKSDYSVALEKELSDVKRTNRALKLALEEAQVAVTSAKAESSSQAVAVRHCSEEMSHLRAQLDESRQTVDRLIHEKTESVAALRHEQLRSVHLQQIMSRLKGKTKGDVHISELPGSLSKLADVESRLQTALWRITQLSGERDRLTQLSNKQRATIRHLETSLASAATNAATTTPAAAVNTSGQPGYALAATVGTSHPHQHTLQPPAVHQDDRGYAGAPASAYQDRRSPAPAGIDVRTHQRHVERAVRQTGSHATQASHPEPHYTVQQRDAGKTRSSQSRIPVATHQTSSSEKLVQSAPKTTTHPQHNMVTAAAAVAAPHTYSPRLHAGRDASDGPGPGSLRQPTDVSPLSLSSSSAAAAGVHHGAAARPMSHDPMSHDPRSYDPMSRNPTRHDTLRTSPETSESMQHVWAMLDKGLSEIDSTDTARSAALK
ncbi:coiled-coil domain-containing protein 57-like [Sycon ciliatum]|uniref:coiled-coil domain-containing protein 57-like n=1 Tax=Sycon ciliatum TaxID=27933 RepID=UPI0031F68309